MSTLRLRLVLLAPLLSWSLVAAWLMAPGIARAAEDLAIGSTVTVTGTEGRALRIRSGPGIGHRIVTVLAEGSTVRVLAGPVSDGTDEWYQVASEGSVTGWSPERYLMPAQSGASSPGGGRYWRY